MAQIEDPHPWSPFRWLLEITFNGILEDFPVENYPQNPNYREELFTRCVECCMEEWTELTPDQKQQFIGTDIKLTLYQTVANRLYFFCMIAVQFGSSC